MKSCGAIWLGSKRKARRSLAAETKGGARTGRMRGTQGGTLFGDNRKEAETEVVLCPMLSKEEGGEKLNALVLPKKLKRCHRHARGGEDGMEGALTGKKTVCPKRAVRKKAG